jgi:hypothetical protein
MAESIKESLVKKAVKDFDWPALKFHLDSQELSWKAIKHLLDILQRCNGLVFKRPDKDKAKLRATLFDKLSHYIESRAGGIAADYVKEELSLFEIIDLGYLTILESLEQTKYAKLEPPAKVANSISWACDEFTKLQRQYIKTFEAETEIILLTELHAKDDEGNAINLDDVCAGITNALTMILQMESYQQKWVSELDNNTIIIPATLPEITNIDEESKQAGFIGAKHALLWKQWENAEEKLRYFKGHLRIINGSDIPIEIKNLIPTVKTAYIFEPEGLDWGKVEMVANERMNRRMAQNYHQFRMETNVAEKAVGITGSAELIPNAFISLDEVHAADTLNRLFSFPIDQHEELYGDLKLVEWVRGYTALSEKASQHFDFSYSGTQNLVQIWTHEELDDLLQRLGLINGSASILLQRLTLKRSSRDLFDCPLIQLSDGNYLVFLPVLVQANIPRTIISILSSINAKIRYKGPAFEKTIQQLFLKAGMTCKSFKVTRDGQEYEYDAVVVWEDYVFVFECKSRSLSDLSPMNSFFALQEAKSFIKQVKRLSGALTTYPDILSTHFDIDITQKTVVPCIVNVLPFSLPGPLDGVFFTDQSSISRFFEDKYFRILREFDIGDGKKVIHRLAFRQLWDGDTPASKDFMRQLHEPTQFISVEPQIQIQPMIIALNNTTLGVNPVIIKGFSSFDEILTNLGVDPEVLKTEIDAVQKQIDDYKKSKSDTDKS